jgi:leucyl/phenylalanyl-tRNA--protein transferase
MRIIDFPFKHSWVFPHPAKERNGEFPLISGGKLIPERLLTAYAWGIFPWYSEGYPVSWYSLMPRCIITPSKAIIEKNLRPILRKRLYHVTFDTAFEQVIENCAIVQRTGQRGTWITDDLKNAFTQLHEMHWAHSVEVWDNDELVGGLYGMAIGKVFFGESMFHLRSNASKIAFAYLIAFLQSQNYTMIDCQMESPLVNRFGSIMVEGDYFYAVLKHNLLEESENFSWQSLKIQDPLFN